MRVERRCVVTADRDTIWKVIGDPDCYPTFMATWRGGKRSPTARPGLELATPRTGRSVQCRSVA